jgi:hypothetical protein
MRMRTSRLLAAVIVATLAAAAACAQTPPPTSDPTRGARASTIPSAVPSPTVTATPTPTTSDVAMAAPAALRKPTLTPDLLVYSRDTLPEGTVRAVGRVSAVKTVETFSLAQFFAEERSITYAAVDPRTFRRYTPSTSAQTLAVWKRVAGGEMAIAPALGRKIQDTKGYVRMGNDTGSPQVHIGAYADMVPRLPGTPPYIDAVVNERWAKRLKMKQGNAMLVSIGDNAPRPVQKKLQKLLGSSTSVRILGVDLDIHTTQTAVLTGGSVSDALGTLTYTANRDGSVNPDPAWVASYIRTESVPILGRVTCNKVMLPELRAALTEIVDRGLASKIHVGEYGGCFVPRFIAGTSSLSFHTFGTAIDINVPGNQRGTSGQIDRTVVSIFEHWGFQWGGTWRYTDPMHFELHRIVAVR